MDDIYDNLEDYEDVKKVDEIKLENKELKKKVEEYTTTIDKLQRDLDKLAAEHKRLEHNYSALLKTARAEIERKTQMINNLNMEKDKLIISARQNKIKDIHKYKRNENNKSKNNKGSDSSVYEQSDKVISKIQNSKAYCKIDNVSSVHSFNDGKTDPISTIDMGRNNLNKNNIQGSKHCVPKENDMQVLNKLDNRNSETKLKKISNRRKSMPVLSSNEIKFSSDEDENSTELETSKKNYKTKEESVKRLFERNYNGNKMSETSSVENYSRHHDTFNDNYNKNRTSKRSRDRYECSYRKRERDRYSPERSYQRGANKYEDDYYQRYNYGSRRTYESPPCEKSYHNSRSRDHRSNYNKNHSHDSIRNRNDDERYVEKHKLLDDFDEPSFKRQKFDHGHRYAQDHIDYNRWQNEQDYSEKTVHSPLEDLREQLSCQSPDHVYPDYFMLTHPIKEIKYTANVPLEDPRRSSKKYKIVNWSNKEFITTIGGRNVDILPVNKTNWGYVPVPMPKLLLEPPQSLESTIKYTNCDNHNPSSYNLRKKSPPVQKINNTNDHVQKNNAIRADNGSFVKSMQNSTVGHNFFTENTLCKDDKQNKETVKNYNCNANLEASLRGECKNKKMGNTIGAHMDLIVKDICNDINMDTVKEILKETSKNSLTQECNSMPKINPISIKEKNNVDKEMIQNMDSLATLDNDIKNTATEKATRAPVDKIAKNNGCKNSNMVIAKENVSTSKESSKNNLIQELNSMPSLNLNPAFSNKEKNVKKEMVQNKIDDKNNEVIKEDKDHKFDVLTNIVERDLSLSDETNDDFDINPKSNKKDKVKIKKKKDMKSCNKTESVISSKVEDFTDKKKQRVQKDRESSSPEHIKRHKNKKKIVEKKGSDSDPSKETKIKRSKKEKQTKTDEMKSKFNDLFGGESNSLITLVELGVEGNNENEISNNYDTIFEDTQAAVDLNLKEIEKNLTSRFDCQNYQNESLNKNVYEETNLSGVVPDCTTVKENNYDKNQEIESIKQFINDNEVKEEELSVVKDTLTLPNANGNLNSESPDIVKTIIISSGMQPQNVVEDHEDLTQSKNIVKSTEKPNKSVPLYALATSTPAKAATDIAASESVFSKAQDCSSDISSTNSKVLSTAMDQSRGTHMDSLKREDMPDVRIFVKRRRKIKSNIAKQ